MSRKTVLCWNWPAVWIDVVDKVSGARRAEETATGLVQGNPVSVAIVERDPSLLPVITNAVAAVSKSRFGEEDLRAHCGPSSCRREPD